MGATGGQLDLWGLAFGAVVAGSLVQLGATQPLGFVPGTGKDDLTLRRPGDQRRVDADALDRAAHFMR